jgi:hypothetical protein
MREAISRSSRELSPAAVRRPSIREHRANIGPKLNRYSRRCREILYGRD